MLKVLSYWLIYSVANRIKVKRQLLLEKHKIENKFLHALCFSFDETGFLPAMEKHFDTLRLELIDPYEAKEKWAVEEYFPGLHAVRIYVNNNELNSLFVELEDKEDGTTRPTQPSDMYGHVGLWLAKDLKSESAASYGVSLCCCSDCGDEGCWGVRAKVRENEDEVVWYGFEHEHRPYTYGGLEFHFERRAYDAQMEILEGWVKQYCSS